MMKKVSVIISLLILLLSNKIFAQIEFDFSGYIVDLPIYQSTNEKISTLFGIDKNQIINLTRLRLKPVLYLWENSRLNLEYEITALYYNSPGAFSFTNSGRTNRQIVDLTWNPINEQNFSVSHFIDRLYFKQNFDFGEVVIGRQRISWGTGRIWNPTDLFNPINPASYYKNEKDGADALSMKFFLGDFTDLNLVYNPKEKIAESNFGFRFRTNFNEFDLSLMGGYFDKQVVAGLDFAGNLFDAGVRGEGIITADKNDLSNYRIKFILGADYQFTSEFYALLEYQFNGEGKTDKFKYELFRLMKGEILNLSKNYFVVSGFYQITPLFAVSLTNNICANDKSGFTALIANYSLTQDIYVSLGGQIFYGDDFTEYWYYPNSIYLQGEYYF
ncbi:MAG: hypothetical protein V1720_21005 [bacterium]